MPTPPNTIRGLWGATTGAVGGNPAAGQQLRDWGLWQQPTPDLFDEAIIMRQLQVKQRLARMGRQSTFLTGPRGLGGPSSDIARSFLMAAWNDAQDRIGAVSPAGVTTHTTRPAPPPNPYQPPPPPDEPTFPW